MNFTAELLAKYCYFKQDFEHNRKEKKELLERKIGQKKSKIDSSLLRIEAYILRVICGIPAS